MHLLHFSIGSSDAPFPNPMQVPSASLPAVPIFFCMLHVFILFSILHFLHTILFPAVHPFSRANVFAHSLLTPVSLDLQPVIHSPQISQYTSVSTILMIAICFPFNIHILCLLLHRIPLLSVVYRMSFRSAWCPQIGHLRKPLFFVLAIIFPPSFSLSCLTAA